MGRREPEDQVGLIISNILKSPPGGVPHSSQTPDIRTIHTRRGRGRGGGGAEAEAEEEGLPLEGGGVRQAQVGVETISKERGGKEVVIGTKRAKKRERNKVRVEKENKE